ncbi:MAG: GAF domain-containing protein, partial [bacterium]
SQGGRDEIDHWLAEHRTALLVNNLTHDVRFTHEFGRVRKSVSMVAVPLFREGTLNGSLRLSSAVPQAFSHDDLRFTSEAASLLLPVLFPRT